MTWQGIGCDKQRIDIYIAFPWHQVGRRGFANGPMMKPLKILWFDEFVSGKLFRPCLFFIPFISTAKFEWSSVEYNESSLVMSQT